jgi:hypothetical protein
MSIQAIATPPALLPAVHPDARDPTQDDAPRSRARPGSPITITRVDKQDYPDGYVVITTTYANKTSASKTAPVAKSAPAPLVATTFDPKNGGQLSTLLAAQEGGGGVAVAGANPYRR